MNRLEPLGAVLSKYKESLTQYVSKQSKSNRTHVMVPMGSSATESMYDVEDSWRGWQKPTVGWLLQSDWHKVDNLQSEYKSVEEYVLRLRQMWTMLTFYWGTAALWPACNCGGGGHGGERKQPCGVPLLTRVREIGGVKCSSKLRNGSHCQHSATWQCFRLSHGNDHQAICSDCLQKRQELLIGRPDVGSSTDIYDATVIRTHFRDASGGLVYRLEQLRSRKPPTIAPNWRTSYRLQQAALVAVVKLGSRGQCLDRNDSIQWGEIVSVESGPDAARYESKRREEGVMAVRLLNCGDCSVLSAECDLPLEVGVRVAVVDLRVFVPEVISVLSTFTHNSFLPNLKDIPFMDALIGRSRNNDAPDEFNHDHNKSPVENIQNAIGCSQIEVVRRLTVAERGEIATKICHLNVVKTLIGAQLSAFTNALAHAAHCTQGPPGTGKVVVFQVALYMMSSLQHSLFCDYRAIWEYVWFFL